MKLDSQKLDELPAPRPLVEIFVYSPSVEGVHLRYRQGRARRHPLVRPPEDFRTEVLGLVKAQQVKNAVIVPVGAKGGFYPKQMPANATRDEAMAAGVAAYRPLHRRAARRHRQPASRRLGRATARLRAPRRRRSLSRRRRRQGHGDLLRHRQWHRGGARLLARRRVRVGGQPRLRPQEDGHHREGCLGSGQAPLPRDGPRHPERGLHLHRRRRHVGRRVRQRHAAVEMHQVAGRLRSPPHLHRSRSGSGQELGRAQAHVRPAALELGRLRQVADQQGRRRLRARAEADPTLAADAGGRGPRRRQRDAGRADEGAAQGRRGPAVVRRHRHLCQIVVAEQCRSRRPRQRRRARQRRRHPREGCRRRRQSRLHPARPRRIRAGRRAHQHRRDRQLGRVDTSRPRGQSQDTVQRPAAPRRADAGRARQASRRHDRRRRRSRAAGQLRPDADLVGGAVARAQGPRRTWTLHARAGGARPARSRGGIPARRRAASCPRAERQRADAAGTGGAARLCKARPEGRVAGEFAARRSAFRGRAW